MKELPEKRADAIGAFKDLQEVNINLRVEAAGITIDKKRLADLEKEVLDLKAAAKKGKPGEGEDRDGSGWIIDK